MHLLSLVWLDEPDKAEVDVGTGAPLLVDGY